VFFLAASTAAAQTPPPASSSTTVAWASPSSPELWIPSRPSTAPPVQQVAMQQPPVRQVAMQQPPVRPRTPPTSPEEAEFAVELEPPGLLKLTAIRSERTLREWIRQDARRRFATDRMVFPDEPVLPQTPMPPRNFAPMVEVVEPHYVCYRRLYFEQINSERYDWDLGILDPLVEVGKFYWDLAWLPYHMGTRPCEKYECSAGYCLPGDPVPFYLYPPECSLTGAATEAGVVAGLFGLFP
jgi:hypothetical protein